jgi:hypothetical protein
MSTKYLSEPIRSDTPSTLTEHTLTMLIYPRNLNHRASPVYFQITTCFAMDQRLSAWQDFQLTFSIPRSLNYGSELRIRNENDGSADVFADYVGV